MNGWLGSTRALVVASVVAGVASLGPSGCEPKEQSLEEQGKEHYDRVCGVCHGANGEGYVADAAPAISHPNFLATATDDFLLRAIERGRPGTTMSAFGRERGGPFDRAEAAAIVAYMRTWQTTPSIDVSRPIAPGDAKRAEPVYASSCAGCHGATGTEGPYTRLANPELLAAATDGFLRYAIEHGRAPTPMKAYGPTLDPVKMDDLVALLRSRQTAVEEPPTAPAPSSPNVLHASGPEPAFTLGQRFTPADVIKGELDRGAKMIFADARAPSDFAAEHITGATSVPFYDADLYRDVLPRDTWIVAYCGCPHAASGKLMDALLSYGFTKVTILDEGYYVWKERGYPVKAGASP